MFNLLTETAKYKKNITNSDPDFRVNDYLKAAVSQRLSLHRGDTKSHTRLLFTYATR
jgi:hypothetical protein